MASESMDAEEGDADNAQELAVALIQMLDDDVTRLLSRHDKLVEAILAPGVTAEEYVRYEGEYASLKREIFRAFFAYVEGTVYSLKQYARVQLDALERPLASYEVDAVLEGAWRIKDNGVVEYRPANITFMQNLMFMVRLQERLHGLENQLDRNATWFSCLVDSVDVRNRLMHPKGPLDLEVDVEDLKTLFLARDGFIAMLESFLGARPWTLPDVWKHRPEQMASDLKYRVRKSLGMDPEGKDWPGWPVQD